MMSRALANIGRVGKRSRRWPKTGMVTTMTAAEMVKARAAVGASSPCSEKTDTW